MPAFISYLMKTCIIVASFTIWHGSASANCSKPITISYSDWRPVKKKHPKKPYTDEEIVKLIFQTAGCNLTIRFSPMKRLRSDIRHGLIDGSAGASITPERQKHARFSTPYRLERLVIFMRSNEIETFRPTKTEDLFSGGRNIGASVGYWHGEAFENTIKKRPDLAARIMRSDDLEIMFQWLLRKRVDIVINHLHHGLHVLEENPSLVGVSPHPYIVNEGFVHLMFSKKSVPESDVKIINAAIKKLQNTAEYKRLLYLYNRTGG